jgi:hypothetical protein
MNSNRSRISVALTGGLGIINVALLALITRQLVSSGDPKTAAESTEAFPASDFQAFARPAEDMPSNAVWVARPGHLFGTSLAMAKELISEANDAALLPPETHEEPPAYVLRGTFLSPDGRHVALITDEQRQSVTVVQGELVGGWRFNSIQGSRVLIENGLGEEADLALYINDAGVPDRVSRRPGASEGRNDSEGSQRDSQRTVRARRFSAPR